MKRSTVTAQLPCDCKTVWDIVTDNKNYEWRGDLSKIEMIDENRFDEYTKRFFRGVMLIGTMEVLEDAEAKQMIWLEGDTMYYPQGVTDPDYCVLKFTAEKGRYYSNFKSEDFDV